MKIKLIKIVNLHGYLNTEVKVDDHLSLLVGINGSGKTSTLNVINWMFNLDLGRLCSESFDQIQIEFLFDQNQFVFSAVQIRKRLEIVLENVTLNYTFPKMTAELPNDPKSILRSPNKKLLQFKTSSTYTPEKDELQTWNFIESLPSPMIIGLDRTLYTGNRKGFNLERVTNFSEVISDENEESSNSPLQTVSKLLSRKYTQHTNALLKLNRTLNETIVLSAFNEVYTSEQINTLINQKTPSIKVIERLKEQVLAFLRDNHNWNSRSYEFKDSITVGNVPEKRINDYFDNLSSVLRNSEKGNRDLAYIVNLSQFKKVDELITAFSEFEVQTQKEIAPLNEFIEVVNGFLIDSAKKLYFEKESGMLRFKVIKKDGSVLCDEMNIQTLSSGEKQILILLTYIKYRREKLFLIDEPELSLHLKWQEQFLEAINKIKRRNSQLIIATHSPEIIGNFRQNCSVLNPYSV